MTSQFWRPTRECAQRICFVWSSVGAVLLLATPALCDAVRVNPYNSWRWNGFSWSPPPVDATLKTASATSSVGSSSSLGSNPWRSAGSLRTTQSTSTDPLSSLVFSALADTGVSPSAAAGGSLAGYVYVDNNSSGSMDTNDWAIVDAEISLSLNGASEPLGSVRTNKDGSYSFNSLVAGIYSVTMLSPCSMPGKDTTFTIRDKDGVEVPAKMAAVDATVQDTFSNIDLSTPGDTGQKFNFAELVYPLSLVSKRLLIGDDPGIIHTVPEPGTLVLLAIAAVCFGGLACRRCRRSAA